MARLYQDGFEFNSTTANLNTWFLWAGSTVGTTNVRSGTYAMRVSSLVSATAQGALKNWIAATAPGPFFLRAYIKVVTLPTASNNVMFFNGATGSVGTTPRASISLESNGTLILRNSTNTSIGSASSAINDGTFHMLELKVDGNPASGSKIIEGRLDGSVFATSSAQSQGNPLAFAIGGNLASETQTTGEWWFDDVALNDSTGSFQTGYPGSGKLLHLLPNAQGDANTWLVGAGGTAGTANNFTRVNQVTPDDATTYNASTGLGTENDFYNMADSGIGSSDTVNVVAIGTRFRKNLGTGGSDNFHVQLEKTASGTVAQGSSILPNATTWNSNATASPFNYSLVTYQDPDGAAWTQTTLDSMQAGIKVGTTASNTTGVTSVWASVDYTPNPSPTTINASTLPMMGV